MKRMGTRERVVRERERQSRDNEKREEGQKAKRRKKSRGMSVLFIIDRKPRSQQKWIDLLLN
jgi:hypothetical protein